MGRKRRLGFLAAVLLGVVGTIGVVAAAGTADAATSGGVKFAYYDHRKKEWQTDWSTLDASGTPYLPAHVRITLTVVDDRGKEVSYSTDARIQVTENVSYRPAPG